MNTRLTFLKNCTHELNNTINTREISLEPNFLYENCSEKLRSKIVSPAQEYFQYFENSL